MRTLASYGPDVLWRLVDEPRPHYQSTPAHGCTQTMAIGSRQALEWFDRIDTDRGCQYHRAVTFATVGQARDPTQHRSGTLETFFHQHNMRFAHVLEDSFFGLLK